jgi:phage/plasmid-like protein (TIGR03299 family)
MPDMIASYEGNVLMAVNVNRGHPWHRLGHQVEEDMGIEHALEISGSDDFVAPATLYTINEDEHRFLYHTDGHTYVRLDQLEEVQEYQAAKSDKYGTLGVHSPGYLAMQRREILELAYEITGLSDDGAHIDTIGNLGDPLPKMFFTYIRVPDLVIDPNGVADVIERGLFAATSFNGSLANIIGYSNVRVVCFNTLNVAIKGAQQLIKVKHTINSEERMKVAARALQYVGAVEEQVVERAEQMLKVKGDDALDKLLDSFWPLDDDLSDAGKTRRTNERGSVRMLYEGEGNTNVSKVGRNGWAAYNAVVEYADHAKGVKVKDAGVQRAQRSVLPGPTVDMKIKASQLVLG